MTLFQKIADFKAFLTHAWALSQPYFRSDEKWRARGLLAAIVALNLGAVYMLVQINDWNRLFYDALQNRQADVFWQQLGRFAYLAFAFILIAVYRFYLTQLLEMRWRAWLTAHYTQRWLANQAFYRLELGRFGGSEPKATPDNPDQRIQEDIQLFTSDSVALSMGLLNALVTLASFVGILWTLSGDFALTVLGTTYHIAGFMVWMALIYCLAGSLITHYIGRPLIRLNFDQQRYEADFRHHLMRVREYSEAIALDRGESVERGQLDLRFSRVLANYLRLLKAQKSLTWFTVGFSQAAVVFPFIVAAPRFFSGAIQLGTLMQIASAFGRVQDGLSWFVDNYDRLASWRATTDRLTSFDAALTALEQASPTLAIQPSTELAAQALDIGLPGGEQLLADAALRVAPGDSVLIQGASGSGKSTLFRTLAGIWPFASGRLSQPSDAMFVPQRPYFPQGPLRDTLAYPQSPADYSDAQLRQALAQAELAHLGDRLDQAEAWGQALSGGEQQRLALARVFLRRPAWVFADEATSALDSENEQTLYQRLRVLVQQTGGALVSIAHRPALARHHSQTWRLDPRAVAETARFELRQPRQETGE